MAHPIKTREQAELLRKQGYSIKEIAEKINISKSTSSLWLANVFLSKKALYRLKLRRIYGQYKSRLILIEKQRARQKKRSITATELLSKIRMSKEIAKLCCSLLFWCEGSKTKTNIRFTSSDPSLIKLFLFLLKKGFSINETKFRALMHLHNYHDEARQKSFWQKVTHIPPQQFNRTYWKPNTGKRKHKEYPGCIAVTYYDAEIAKELQTIYNSFVDRSVGQW